LIKVRSFEDEDSKGFDECHCFDESSFSVDEIHLSADKKTEVVFLKNFL